MNSEVRSEAASSGGESARGGSRVADGGRGAARDAGDSRGSTRSAWVDVARGIAITLMVAGHVVGGLAAKGFVEKGGIAQRFYDWTYAFHMPAFFMLSGLFIESSLRRGTGPFVLERLRSLYYPFVVWNIAYWLPGRLVEGLTTSESPKQFPLKYLYHPREGMWFLMTLLVLSAAYALARRARVPAWALLAAAVGGVVLCWPMPQPKEDEARAVLLHLAWFGSWLMAGAAFSGAIREGAARISTAVLVIVGAACAIGLTATLAPTDIRQPPRPIGAPLGVVMVLAWSMALARLAGGPMEWFSRGLAVLGERSLEIYLVSGFGMVGARMVLTRLLDVTEPGVLAAAGMLGGMVLPLAVWWVADRVRFPWLFRFGRRG